MSKRNLTAVDRDVLFPDTAHHDTIFDVPVEDAIDFSINTIGISTSGQDVFQEGEDNPVGVVLLNKEMRSIHGIYVFTIKHFSALRNEIKALLTTPDLTVGHVSVYEVGLSPEKVAEITEMCYGNESEEGSFFGIDLFQVRRINNEGFLTKPYHLARRLRMLLTQHVFQVVSGELLGGGVDDHLVKYISQFDDHALVNFVMYHFYSMFVLASITGAIKIPHCSSGGFMYTVDYGVDSKQFHNTIFLISYQEDQPDWMVTGTFTTDTTFELERHIDEVWSAVGDRTKLRRKLRKYLGGTLTDLHGRYKNGTFV